MQGVWAQNRCSLRKKCLNETKCFETKNKQKMGTHNNKITHIKNPKVM